LATAPGGAFGGALGVGGEDLATAPGGAFGAALGIGGADEEDLATAPGGAFGAALGIGGADGEDLATAPALSPKAPRVEKEVETPDFAADVVGSVARGKGDLLTI